MTWEIVLGIIALVGFIGSIATWVFKLSRVLTMLSTTLEGLGETLREFRANSRQTHKEIFHELEKHGEQLVDHEQRIKFIEKGTQK